MDHISQISSFLSYTLHYSLHEPYSSAPYPNSFQDFCIADLRASPFNKTSPASGGINSPHSHPGATEAGVVIEGSVSVGFLTTNYTLFSKVIGPGDMFVILQEIIPYEWNVGKTQARLLTVVADELPSEVVLPRTLFLTKPTIPNAVFMEAFRTNGKPMNMLWSKFTT